MDFFKKSYILFVSSFLFLFGCQATQTEESAVDSSTHVSAEKDTENILFMSETAENTATEDSKEGEADNNLGSQPESPGETFSFTIGDGENLGELNVKLLKVYEINAEHYPPSKDKFIGIEVEIENKSEEPVKISTLNNLSLIVNGSKQDLAIIDTEKTLNVKIQPGEKIIGQVAFDTKNSEQYRFTFIDPTTSKEIQWSFSENNIESN